MIEAMARDFNNIASYISLCILRLWCAALPGYVHPDEFFQSPEIMGGLYLFYYLKFAKII